MNKNFALSIFVLLSVTLLTLVNLGCSVNVPDQIRGTVTSAKPQESLFTVIETEDLEYPVVVASIRLPFRVRAENTVALTGTHAYLTTERHLHVIDVSIPQRPSYLTSLAFPHDIGKVLVCGDSVVVATSRKFYLVDVSLPSVPVLQSTVYLPERHAITDFDVRDAHLYVIGTNDSLYIFSVDHQQARLVKAVKLEKRWWLLSPEVVRSEVKQIPLSTSNAIPRGLSDPLLSQRGFLQLRSSRQEEVRISSEFLVLESLRDPTCDLLIVDAVHIPRVGKSPIIRTGMGRYNVETECLNYLTAIGEKNLARQQPTIAYTVVSGKMRQIVPEPASKTINANDKRVVGPVTDFQMSEDLLYVVNANGLFSITRFFKMEDHPEEKDLTQILIEAQTSPRLPLTTANENACAGFNYRPPQFLSATPLQASHPMSIAVGNDYACVLAAPEGSLR